MDDATNKEATQRVVITFMVKGFGNDIKLVQSSFRHPQPPKGGLFPR